MKFNGEPVGAEEKWSILITYSGMPVANYILIGKLWGAGIVHKGPV